jgi:uncharacterized protein YbjT (DUF2867 family)
VSEAEDPVIVVCGATGNQGGAAVSALLAARKWRVAALVRDPERGRALEGRGVELRRGDLLDEASLVAAFRGAHAVFGVTQPWSKDYRRADTRGEVRQGRALIDACAATRTRLVFSTVLLRDDRPTGISHVDSKLELEAYLRQKGLPAVVLGPASFMDNIGLDFFPVRRGRVRGFVDADARVPLVACRDIGRAAASVLDDLHPHLGKRHNLIGGLYSGLDICDTLSRLRGGEKFRYGAPPRLLMRLFAREFYLMRRTFEEAGRPPHPPLYDAGLRETAALIGQPTTLEAFLRDKGYADRLL